MALCPRLIGILRQQFPRPLLERRGQRAPVGGKLSLSSSRLQPFQVGHDLTARAQHNQVPLQTDHGRPVHTQRGQGLARRVQHLVQVVSAGVEIKIRP